MEMLSGIGRTDRERLAAIIRGTKGTVSVEEAARILDVASTDAAKMLSRWAKKGWMSRVRRGLYVFVPLESRTADVPLEDPWVVADRLFSPCYIGGWSAAEYFDLTEQIFSTIMVMTIQKPRNRRLDIKGTAFKLRTISEKAMFGLKPV
jgi:predicted transcriptional regulator of viral defense system